MQEVFKKLGQRWLRGVRVLAIVAMTVLMLIATWTVSLIGIAGMVLGKLSIDLSDVFDFASVARRSFHRLFNPMLREAGWHCDDNDEYDQEKRLDSPARRMHAAHQRLRELERNYGESLRRNDDLEKKIASYSQCAKQLDNLSLQMSNMVGQRNKLLELLDIAAGAVTDGMPDAVHEVLDAAILSRMMGKYSVGGRPLESVTITVDADNEGRIVRFDGIAFAEKLSEVFKTKVRSAWYRGKPIAELGLYNISFDLPLFGTVGPVNVWVVPTEVKKLAEETNADLAS